MKNYKNLVPIVLILLFAVGIYMKIDKNIGKINEYNAYIEDARSYREKGIAVDAEKNYLEAVKVQPSVELSVEIGEFYNELIGSRKAMNWAGSLVEEYPEDVAGYEFALGLYKDMGRYEDFFNLYDIAQKRGVNSELIKGYVKELNNTFYYVGKYDDVGHYAEGFCKVQKDDIWSYVDMSGKTTISSKFVSAGNFCDGVASVEDKLGEKYLADTAGNKKYIVENIKNVERIGSYDDELCTIYDGKTWGIYKLDGELKHGGYSDVSTIANGVVAVEKDGKWSVFNLEGEKVFSETYDGVKQDGKGIVYRQSRFFVKKDEKYYMLDAEGKKVVKTAFEDAKIFNVTGLAAVKMDGKWGFIDQEGKMVIEPKYEDANSFSNGYAAVKQNGKWGFIDEKGKIFIECQFEDVRDFTSSGSVFVKQGPWRLLRLYAY